MADASDGLYLSRDQQWRVLKQALEQTDLSRREKTDLLHLVMAVETARLEDGWCCFRRADLAERCGFTVATFDRRKRLAAALGLLIVQTRTTMGGQQSNQYQPDWPAIRRLARRPRPESSPGSSASPAAEAPLQCEEAPPQCAEAPPQCAEAPLQCAEALKGKTLRDVSKENTNPNNTRVDGHVDYSIGFKRDDWRDVVDRADFHSAEDRDELYGVWVGKGWGEPSDNQRLRFHALCLKCLEANSPAAALTANLRAGRWELVRDEHEERARREIAGMDRPVPEAAERSPPLREPCRADRNKQLAALREWGGPP